MKHILKQINKILFTGVLVCSVVICTAQVKKTTKRAEKSAKQTQQPVPVLPLKEFTRLAAEANVQFVFPAGFKEVKALDNEYFSFDYGIALPGADFELWFQVRSLKQNWASYDRKPGQLANPDSLYLDIGKAHAIALSGSRDYFMRNIPPEVLADYNADVGKTYLLNLLDSPATKHYKYALLITLQKDHTGTILAVAFTNDKGRDFFRNINKARNCIRFK